MSLIQRQNHSESVDSAGRQKSIQSNRCDNSHSSAGIRSLETGFPLQKELVQPSNYRHDLKIRLNQFMLKPVTPEVTDTTPATDDN